MSEYLGCLHFSLGQTPQLGKPCQPEMNQKDEKDGGARPLHYGVEMNLLLAADAGDLTLVRELMKGERANVNKKFKCSKFNYRCTALHYACRSGHLDVATALIEDFGADVNARDCQDWTPVYYATNNGFAWQQQQQHQQMIRMI